MMMMQCHLSLVMTLMMTLMRRVKKHRRRYLTVYCTLYSFFLKFLDIIDNINHFLTTKVELGKKRPSDAAHNTPVPAKKAKPATPQKTGDFVRLISLFYYFL